MRKTALFLTLLLGIVSISASQDDPETGSGHAGSVECRTCHPDAYDAWASSRHAAGFPGGEEAKDSFNPGREWIQNCAGCHTTGMNISDGGWTEPGVGCEACHGPGKEHALTADADRIVSDVSADICGRCHSGNLDGSGLMSDGTRWIVGFEPGMDLSDVSGLQLSRVDADELPPLPLNNHPLTYNMWKASGHSRQQNRKFTVGEKEWSGPVTCVACHDPHQSEHPHQLAEDPESLCGFCHSQMAVLKGTGAQGVPKTRSLHTAIDCVDCHMTEKNHLMRVLRPDDARLPDDRTDSCSACHEVKDREVRAYQIRDWEAWYRETLEPVQDSLRAVEEALAGNPDALNAELKEKLEVTKSNLEIVLQDGSNGVHNLDFTLEIMALAKRELANIRAAID